MVKYPQPFDHKYRDNARIFTDTSRFYQLKSFDLMFLLAVLDDPFSGGGRDSHNGARKNSCHFFPISIWFQMVHVIFPVETPSNTPSNILECSDTFKLLFSIKEITIQHRRNSEWKAHFTILSSTHYLVYAKQ